jgi:hypothetical protein
MMAESINQRMTLAQGNPMTNRQLTALLQSLLVDVKALQAALAAHQHAALNAAPSTGAAVTLNTSA